MLPTRSHVEADATADRPPDRLPWQPSSDRHMEMQAPPILQELIQEHRLLEFLQKADAAALWQTRKHDTDLHRELAQRHMQWTSRCSSCRATTLQQPPCMLCAQRRLVWHLSQYNPRTWPLLTMWQILFL